LGVNLETGVLKKFKIMREYIRRDLRCLIDVNTQEPIRIYVPKDEVERYNEISRKAFEAGYRFRQGLIKVGIV